MKYSITNLGEKFTKFSDHWSSKIIAKLNEYHLKLVKFQGDFIWHTHPDTDEAFIVIEGKMSIYFRDGKVVLKEGGVFVVPKGAEHKPCSIEEYQVMLIEPAGTLNTEDTGGDMTASNNIWI